MRKPKKVPSTFLTDAQMADLVRTLDGFFRKKRAFAVIFCDPKDGTNLEIISNAPKSLSIPYARQLVVAALSCIDGQPPDMMGNIVSRRDS